ncbi:MAG: hypothetical protein ACLQVM_15760 [Terriglobia bacterium]
MTPDVFAEWLRCQGQQVVRTASTYWHGQGPRVFQAFPYHWIVRPSEEELRSFLREHGIIAARYSTALDAPLGCLSYHGVYEKPTYDFEDLDESARRNVRRGLRNCAVEQLPFALLGREGWALQQDTLERQGRHVRLSREDWRRRCESAAALPGFEAWGALVEGALAASVITFQMDDCCYILYPQSRREFLTARVNHALSFVVTKTMRDRTGVRTIFYGLHSLDAPASTDEFKLRMGYTAKPVRQRVVFHPQWAPVFNPVTHAVLKFMKRLRPGSPMLSKAEGMVRFYLQGKRPAEQQQMPEPLRSLALDVTDPELGAEPPKGD